MSKTDSNGPPFRVSHVVFDIDGTLIDFVGAYRAGMAAAASRATELTGAFVTPSDLRAAQRTAVAGLRAQGWAPAGARAQALHRALTTLGCDEAGAASSIEAFNTTRDACIRPYDDVEETLEALEVRGFVLVAASNGNAEMTRSPIFRHFSAAWLAEAAGLAKPDPEFFRGALTHVGAVPETSLMVGDRIDNDYEPARSIGMHAVLIDRKSRVDDTSVVRIEALTELLALIEPL